MLNRKILTPLAWAAATYIKNNCKKQLKNHLSLYYTLSMGISATYLKQITALEQLKIRI